MEYSHDFVKLGRSNGQKVIPFRTFEFNSQEHSEKEKDL
jgi:hypothetical protein